MKATLEQCIAKEMHRYFIKTNQFWYLRTHEVAGMIFYKIIKHFPDITLAKIIELIEPYSGGNDMIYGQSRHAKTCKYATKGFNPEYITLWILVIIVGFCLFCGLLQNFVA